MDYTYTIVTDDDLWELQKELTSKNVCSRIFEFFDLPNVSGLNDKDSEMLTQMLKNAESVFLSEVTLSVENRVSELSNLVKHEFSSHLSHADEVFLLFVNSENNPLTNKELEMIQNLNDDKFWACLDYSDSQIKECTPLFIIAITERELVYDENEVIDSDLDDICNIPVDEYKIILRKQACEYAKAVVVDAENHSDVVLDIMKDFLYGASTAIKLLKDEFVFESEDDFEDWESAILDNIDIDGLGEYKKDLISQAMSYAKATKYPNNDKTIIFTTIEGFLEGSAAAIKLIADKQHFK